MVENLLFLAWEIALCLSGAAVALWAFKNISAEEEERLILFLVCALSIKLLLNGVIAQTLLLFKAISVVNFTVGSILLTLCASAWLWHNHSVLRGVIFEFESDVQKNKKCCWLCKT